jgi:ATP-dependent Lon protease
MVVYPHGVHPLFVGTESSICALDQAMADDKQILLVAKRDAEVELPEAGDLFPMGTVATVLQLLKLPDGTVKVLVEGGQRAKLHELKADAEFLTAEVETVTEPQVDARESVGSRVCRAQSPYRSSARVHGYRS